MTGDKRFQGLCPMEMAAESANPTKGCRICAVPIQMLIDPPPPPDCGGVSTWGVGQDEETNNIWVLLTNGCTGTGEATPPADPPEGTGLIATVDCCTGEVITIEETP
jgi:hypothetical protein